MCDELKRRIPQGISVMGCIGGSPKEECEPVHHWEGTMEYMVFERLLDFLACYFLFALFVITSVILITYSVITFWFVFFVLVISTCISWSLIRIMFK